MKINTPASSEVSDKVQERFRNSGENLLKAFRDFTADTFDSIIDVHNDVLDRDKK